jgi:hypothetical protein
MSSITIPDKNGAPREIETELVNGKHRIKPGSTDVTFQDSTELPIDLRLSVLLSASATLASSPSIDSYTVSLNTGHGFIANDKIAVFEEVLGLARFVVGVVLVAGANDLTLSVPIPYPFSLSAAVIKYTPDMAVNGSVTPVVFSVTNGNTTPVHVTRATLHLTSSAAMDDSLFGSLTALTRGIVFRKKYLDGSYQHYFSAKTNGELGEIAGGDKTYDSKAGPGLNGLTVRITYNGPDKRGVVIELLTGESIEMLVQDDLTGLDSFSVLMTGHFATDQ